MIYRLNAARADFAGQREAARLFAAEPPRARAGPHPAQVEEVRRRLDARHGRPGAAPGKSTWIIVLGLAIALAAAAALLR
jgi:hypothetical protein